MILNIETSTKCCSVVLASGYDVIAREESYSVYSHAENITIFMERVLKQAGIGFDSIDAVAVSKGPGSYMGLRIGVSAAKGLCYALGKPLIAIDTLEAMALKEAGRIKATSPDAKAFNSGQTLFCPMIDARRMEVYCALYDGNGKNLQATSARIIDAQSFSEYLETQTVYFFGDGAAKCKDVLGTSPNALFDDSFEMSADALVPLSYQKFSGGAFEDTAYFEPFYLKDFIPGASHVKGLK